MIGIVSVGISHCHTPGPGAQGVSVVRIRHTDAPRPRSIAHSARHEESVKRSGRCPGVSRSRRDARRDGCDPAARVSTAEAPPSPSDRRPSGDGPASLLSRSRTRDSPDPSIALMDSTISSSWHSPSPVMPTTLPLKEGGARTGRLTLHPPTRPPRRLRKRLGRPPALRSPSRAPAPSCSEQPACHGPLRCQSTTSHVRNSFTQRPLPSCVERQRMRRTRRGSASM